MSVSPIWEVTNDWIQPISFEPLPPLALEIIELLKQQNTHDIPIFLRGSCIEQTHIHPKSDIDLLIISDEKYPCVSLEGLDRLKRYIDPVVISKDSADVVYTTLLYTRSIQVCGKTVPPKPIQITKKWLFEHWLKYGVYRLPSTLTSQGDRRVAELKQIIRSIGLIWFMKHRSISRDMKICLGWASQLHTEFGHILQDQFHRLDQKVYDPFPIAPISEWIGQYFYEEWDAFTQAI